MDGTQRFRRARRVVRRWLLEYRALGSQMEEWDGGDPGPRALPEHEAGRPKPSLHLHYHSASTRSLHFTVLASLPAWPQKTERLDRVTQTRMGAQCRKTGWSLLRSFLLNVPLASGAKGSSSTGSEGHCQGLYTHWRTEFSDPQRPLFSPLRDEGCRQRLGTPPPGSVCIPQVPS